MKDYNVIYAKEHLPEIIEEIQSYKEMADAELFLYRCLIDDCVYETTHEGVDFGCWTNEDFVIETYNNYISHIERVKYLENLIEKIHFFAKDA